MATTVRIKLDLSIYDDDAVLQTVALFRKSFDVSHRKRGGSRTVTIRADEDADVVAGEFLNLALGTALESRSA